MKVKELGPTDVKPWLPRRRRDSHKGDFGHVLIVAGSRGMSGAAVLSARAASRAGAGLVTLAVPASQQAVVAAQLPEALTLGLPETSAGTLTPEAAGKLQHEHRIRAYSVLAVGPGLTTHPDTARAVLGLLTGLPLPVVIDADALNILAMESRASVRLLLLRRGLPCVLTPHPGEMARLLRVQNAQVQRNRTASARQLAKELGCVCLLKGAGTIVTDGKTVLRNTTGNPGMSKGGSGDALTGILAAVWCQRVQLSGPDADRGLEAAALAAWLHGAAGDLAAREKTVYALLPSDLIEALPGAFRKLA